MDFIELKSFFFPWWGACCVRKRSCYCSFGYIMVCESNKKTYITINKYTSYTDTKSTAKAFTLAWKLRVCVCVADAKVSIARNQIKKSRNEKAHTNTQVSSLLSSPPPPLPPPLSLQMPHERLIQWSAWWVWETESIWYKKSSPFSLYQTYQFIIYLLCIQTCQI